MRRWYRNIFGILAALSMISLLAACGAVGGSGTGSSGGSSSSGGTIAIATDFPITGTDGSEGIPAQNGVKLAVMQNLDLGHGYKLVLKTFDDAVNGVHNPQQGALNVQQIIGDPTILAMVGPFNSNVAKAEIPLTNEAGLAQISPSNTNPGLTLEQYAAANGINFSQLRHPGKKVNYFRIPTNDVNQGTADANYAYNNLHARKVYVLDDSETYGKGLADYFVKQFTNLGGQVLGRDEISSAIQDFSDLITKIKGMHPDLVFFGGVTSEGGALFRKQMVAQGLNVPYEGGDGIAEDPAFLQIAGAAANGTYGTVAAPDLSTFTSGAAAKFVQDYQAAFGSSPGPYSANSYDAAMIIITALKQIINSGQTPTRSNLIDAIHHITYHGVTGTISFDANGDNTNKVLSLYEVKDGKWVYVQQLAVP